MFWAGIATLIMSLTGKGDDTAFFRMWIASMREGIEEHVKDLERRSDALEVLTDTEKRFRQSREDGAKVNACLEKLDRSYEATADQYEECLSASAALWDKGAAGLIDARAKLMTHVTTEEAAAVRAQMVNP